MLVFLRLSARLFVPAYINSSITLSMQRFVCLHVRLPLPVCSSISLPAGSKTDIWGNNHDHQTERNASFWFVISCCDWLFEIRESRYENDKGGKNIGWNVKGNVFFCMCVCICVCMSGIYNNSSLFFLSQVRNYGAEMSPKLEPLR